MNKHIIRQRGDAEGETIGWILATVFVILVLFMLAIGIASDKEVAKHSHRSKHHSMLVVTTDHRLYAHNDDDSWWEFFPTDADFIPRLPPEGAMRITLPSGTWARVTTAPPAASEVEEEEEATVEETVEGQPSEDGQGDMGSDSDSGGDSGGDGGGGDGGGDGGE